MPEKPISETRQAIRTQAQALFVQQGYNAVSMRDIATAVGIRPSAIYNHFPSKQDILVELMRDTMADISSGAQPTDATDHPVQLLQAFARFHISYHIDNPEVGFLSYMELRSLEEPGRSEVIAMRDRYEEQLEHILQRGKDAQNFAIDHPKVVARAILAMLSGVTVWYRKDGPLTRDQIIDTYVDAVLRIAGAPARQEVIA